MPDTKSEQIPPSDQPQPQTQTRSGCLLLALFLVACVFGAYGVVRLIFWLQGEPLPSG